MATVRVGAVAVGAGASAVVTTAAKVRVGQVGVAAGVSVVGSPRVRAGRVAIATGGPAGAATVGAVVRASRLTVVTGAAVVQNDTPYWWDGLRLIPVQMLLSDATTGTTLAALTPPVTANTPVPPTPIQTS